MIKKNSITFDGKTIKGHRGVGGTDETLSTIVSTTQLNTEITPTEDGQLVVIANFTPSNGTLSVTVNGTIFAQFGGGLTTNYISSWSCPVLKGSKIKVTKSTAGTLNQLSCAVYKYNN